MASLFPRHCRLILKDKEGEGIDLGRLSVRFEVVRSNLSPAPGHAKITVINLSLATIAEISKKYTQIELEAGYPERKGTIFKGEVRFVYSMKDGADRVTEIFAKDGALDVEDTLWNGTLLPGTSLRQAVADVAATFKRTLVGSLETLTDQPLRSRLTESRRTVDILDQLAKDYGFAFFIDGGVAQFVDNLRPPGGPALEISPETGMIESPFVDISGIQFVTLLDSRIVPGRRVRITTAGAQVTDPETRLINLVGEAERAQFSKFANQGRFDVLSVTHYGETRGQAWYTRGVARQEGLLGGT